MRSVLKLLAVLAMLLMPFGMAPAAATIQHHGAAMPMQHCPDEQSSSGKKGAFAECTMACSAALPALAQPQPLPVPTACERVRPPLAQQLSDLHPEIATRPPKRA
jgi:hypothetical protein